MANTEAKKETAEKKDYEGFKNKEADEKFEMVGPTWRKGIAWPGVFTGKYCDLPVEALEKLVEAKHPDFKAKGNSKAAAAK